MLARFDDAASRFQGMTARVTYLTHIAVIDDNSEDSGNLTIKKLRANEVQGRIDFTHPPENYRNILFEQRTLKVYTPKGKTLTVYDLGEKGEQVERFIILGFGTSGADLNRDYVVRVLGQEAVRGQKALKLELVPKSAEARAIVAKLELWVPEKPNAPYPIQEKIYDKSPGEYKIVTYTDLKINPPIAADALKLKLPAGVNILHPQK